MFVANERTRVIHDTEAQTAQCGRHCASADDQIPIPDEETAKLMIELEHYVPCPECMRDVNWR
ncbi:MAG TPA: hypothetical protein VKZ69_03705 [Limnochordales bacterium]|nr:hypothetical protein [Limnochordales bacterium]